MQIQVNTDKNIQGDEGLAEHVKNKVTTSLSHFSDRVTRVEVHLSDENGDKHGHKRCMIEVRIEGRPPTAVTCEAENVELAVAGAAHKMKSSLESTLGRLHDHR